MVIVSRQGFRLFFLGDRKVLWRFLLLSLLQDGTRVIYHQSTNLKAFLPILAFSYRVTCVFRDCESADFQRSILHSLLGVPFSFLRNPVIPNVSVFDDASLQRID
jgi:hypothetical protein